MIKMLVNFYRNAHGQNALRDSLGPALQDILMDKDLSIRTDPVDVYKTWINLSETQTGCKRSGGVFSRGNGVCQVTSDSSHSVSVPARCPMTSHLLKL